MKNNNYRAENFRVEKLDGEASPTIHFADLDVSGEVHHWERNGNIFNTSKKTIERAILEDNYLKEKDTGKFIIAFSFGFVIYCFGTPGKEGEIDSTCVKYKEYDFEKEFESFKEIKHVRPCALEDEIKVHERSLWYSSKTIKEYYQSHRKTFKIENKYPNKSFE